MAYTCSTHTATPRYIYWWFQQPQHWVGIQSKRQSRWPAIPVGQWQQSPSTVWPKAEGYLPFSPLEERLLARYLLCHVRWWTSTPTNDTHHWTTFPEQPAQTHHYYDRLGHTNNLVGAETSLEFPESKLAWVCKEHRWKYQSHTTAEWKLPILLQTCHHQGQEIYPTRSTKIVHPMLDKWKRGPIQTVQREWGSRYR